MNVACTIRRLAPLVATAMLAGAIPNAAQAEQSKGWYGAIDLGGNSKSDSPIVSAQAECSKLSGTISRRADGHWYCVAAPVGPVKQAEPATGWYGAIDLGGNSKSDAPTVSAQGECAGLKGTLAKRADGHWYCEATVAKVPVANGAR